MLNAGFCIKKARLAEPIKMQKHAFYVVFTLLFL